VLLLRRQLCHAQRMIPPLNGLDRLRLIARAIPGAIALGRWARRMTDPELRTIDRLIRTRHGQLFQPFPDTAEERYPALFDALAERLADLPSPRILSFGCSSGEEVRALRRRLSQARITGVDLNPRALAKARRADSNPLSHYCSAIDLADRFDAILALAVFRHGALEADRPEDCSAILPFAQVEQGIAALDACLMPGGWLAIHNSHFRFNDTSAAIHFDAAQIDLPEVWPTPVLYGSDNIRIAEAQLLPVLYQKRSGPGLDI
jgi:SAM-dependent methyltransferase